MSHPEEEKSVPAQPGGMPGPSLLVNYLSFLTGNISAKFLSLLTVLMLTRALGVADFGRYSLVFSYWALLNTLIDLGASQILAREIARTPENPRPGVESIIYLRLFACILFLPLGFLSAGWLKLTPDLAWAILYGILVGFEALYDVYFSATMRLDQNAKARFYASLGNLCLMALATWLKAPLLAIVLIGLSNPLVKLIFDWRYAAFRWVLHAPDWPRIGQLVKDGWPLWLLGLQYIVLARVDTFMLQVLVPDGPHQLGIYSAGFRFSEVMALLANALAPALLPLLVAHMDHPERFRFLAHTGLRLILAALIPCSLFIFWYAPWIVKLYGPGYAASADCLRVLIWSQALVAVNSLCYQVLIVYNVQGKRVMLLSGTATTLFNIGLNYWLIRDYGALGASWATVLTEVAMVAFMLWFIRLHSPLRLVREVGVLFLLMGVACLPPILLGEVYGILSIVLFLGLLWLFRLLSLETIRQLARERLQTSPTNPSPTETPDPQNPG